MNSISNYLTPTNVFADYNRTKRLPVQSLNENYRIINPLGVGSFGTVMLAKSIRDKSQFRSFNGKMYGTLLDPLEESAQYKSPLVAIKIMNKRVHVQEYMKNKEVKFILSMPSHPSLIQVFEIFVDPVEFKLHIIMESMNQTLLQLVNSRRNTRLSEKTLKSILSQVLDGIKHIHKHDYFHRDIKPENILVIPTIQYFGNNENIPPSRKDDNYVVKLADYGLSRSNNDLNPYTSYISTRWYRSPEILLRRKWQSKAVDIWAFAVVAVELANFQPLFPGATELDQLVRILKVLGCPSLPDIGDVKGSLNNNYFNTRYYPNYFIPMGGFWREATILAKNLGIEFPYEQGLTIENIFPVRAYKGLSEVVKSCLTWDPDIRPDCGFLSSMDYFKGTQVYEESQPITRTKQINPSVIPLTPYRNYNMSSSSSHSYRQSPTAINPYKNETNYFYDDFDDGYEKQFMYQNQEYDSDYLIENVFNDNDYSWKPRLQFDDSGTSKDQGSSLKVKSWEGDKKVLV